MLALTWPFKYLQLLTWHCTLMYLYCGCVGFCNIKTKVTFLTATLPSHWYTLMLHVADEYVEYINCVSCSVYQIKAFAWQFLARKNKYYIFWVCVCSFCYPAFKAHLFCVVLCCRPWPVWRHCIFPHNLINGTNFGKHLLKTKCVSWSSFVWNLSHSEKNSTKYFHKCT